MQGFYPRCHFRTSSIWPFSSISHRVETHSLLPSTLEINQCPCKPGSTNKPSSVTSLTLSTLLLNSCFTPKGSTSVTLVHNKLSCETHFCTIPYWKYCIYPLNQLSLMAELKDTINSSLGKMLM